MIPSMTMQKGYSPYQTICPLCQNDAEQLVLGTVFIYRTRKGKNFIGFGHAGGPLAHRLLAMGVEYVADIVDQNKKLPADRPCPDCQADLFHQRLEFEREVMNGGLYWRCDMCRKSGVIVAGDSLGFCESVRGAAGIAPPNNKGVTGVSFNHCDQHASVEDPEGIVH